MNFLRTLNQTIKDQHPDVQMIAEESSSFGGVSRPVDQGGLHFDMKWNMGWMHDTLRYISRDPLYRGYHDHEVAFCLYYAFSENFMLSFSHDEVVYGKGSMLTKMPGNDYEKFANMRAVMGYMYGHPGKKLLFMGAEFGQWAEWGHESQLQWELLQYAPHQKLQAWIKDLNDFYKTEAALYDYDFEPSGFEWRDMGESHRAIFSFVRKGSRPEDAVLAVCNFGNIARTDYWVGGLSNGTWKEVLNSDDVKYGGSSAGAKESTAYDGIVTLTIPPLSSVFLKHIPTEV
jgi:1,4-alpha-glucan branching enzyme